MKTLLVSFLLFLASLTAFGQSGRRGSGDQPRPEAEQQVRPLVLKGNWGPVTFGQLRDFLFPRLGSVYTIVSDGNSAKAELEVQLDGQEYVFRQIPTAKERVKEDLPRIAIGRAQDEIARRGGVAAGALGGIVSGLKPPKKERFLYYASAKMRFDDKEDSQPLVEEPYTVIFVFEKFFDDNDNFLAVQVLGIYDPESGKITPYNFPGGSRFQNQPYWDWKFRVAAAKILLGARFSEQ